ncbi:MAG: DNA polymerase IV, partial [Kiritimatiellaeota bacterium]|nr:DNA polymerase IV [Kiritimatiellota bacterium]
MIADRHILHVDMDAFFAAIEQRDHPEWKGMPVIVGASPYERGVISTCSYEARKFGVRSAMPSREAGRLCPHGIYVRPRMAHYEAVSRQVFQIFERYTPWVEGVSCDEAFLDVTGARSLFGAPEAIATRIQDDFRRELHLTGSVGIARNMFLAKLASEMNKPDGQTRVPDEPDAIKAFLAPLPIKKLWGVGPVTATLLNQSGYQTVRDIQCASLGRLTQLLGESLATHLFRLAHGDDDRTVSPDHEEKSISREHTFG